MRSGLGWIPGEKGVVSGELRESLELEDERGYKQEATAFSPTAVPQMALRRSPSPQGSHARSFGAPGELPLRFELQAVHAK